MLKMKEICNDRVAIISTDEICSQIQMENLKNRGYNYDGSCGFYQWIDTLPNNKEVKLALNSRSVNAQINKEITKKVKACQIKGINVVIDTFLDEIEYNFFKDTFQHVVFILVYTPIDELLRNVLSRNKSINTDERRDIVRPFLHYFNDIFRKCDVNNEQRVDIMKKMECERFFQTLEKVITHDEKKMLQNLKKKTCTDYFLNDETTGIQPQLGYNFILTTKDKSPLQCAQTLDAWLTLKS